MAPSELEILNNYLLVPSQLPAIISLQEFTALFPRSLQSSPHVRTLYRDLQSQRNAVVDSVASNIEDEVRRAKGLRRAVVRARKEAENQEFDDEIEIERTLFGDAHSTDGPKHGLGSVLPELEKAVNELEGEMKRLAEEETRLRASVGQNIGSLSDLRYGRLGNNRLPEEVLESLSHLQETCNQKT